MTDCHYKCIGRLMDHVEFASRRSSGFYDFFIFCHKQSMRDRLDDDEDTIIDLPDPPPKPLTDLKRQQLSDARVKALESRRKSQKAALEQRLHQVRLLLGELDGKNIERVQEIMMNQERELRRKQNALTLQFITVLKEEAAKREAEHESLKRSLSKLRNDLQELMQRPKRSAQSTVSFVSSSSKVKIPLAKLNTPLPNS